MGYKSLPITKRSAFKQVPEGAKVTNTSTDSYIEADPTGGLSDVTVKSTDYITPGSSWQSTGVTDEQAYEKADKTKYPTFDAFQAAADAYRSSYKSPDVPGTDESITKKPIMTTDPAVPEKKGDAFYTPEKRKQYRGAKVTRNQREKQAKRDLRKGLIDESTYKQRLKKASDDYNINVGNIEAQTKKQYEQGINPRSGKSVTMQEGKDATTRQKNIKDLSPEERAKLKTTTSTKTMSTGNPTDLASSIMNAAGPIIDQINNKAKKDFTNAITSGPLAMKSGFKMVGFGKKNKK